jgi:hypothetical protein
VAFEPGHEAFKQWNLDHDPETRPLGCNGKYGPSGSLAHKRLGEAVCPVCRESVNHYRREGRRGSGGTQRRLRPCGTNAAAKRHRRNNEELDFRCRVAEFDYNERIKASRKKS